MHTHKYAIFCTEMRFAEKRLIHMSASESANESAESTGGTTRGLFTLEKADATQDKIDRDVAEIQKIKDAHSKHVTELKEKMTAFRIDKDEDTKKDAVDAIRSVINEYVGEMETITGTIDNAARRPTNAKDQLNLYQANIAELQKLLRQLGEDDEESFKALESKFKGLHEDALQQYKSDAQLIRTAELGVSNKTNPEADVDDKIKVFRAASNAYERMFKNLDKLEKDKFAYGDAEGWIGSIIDQSVENFDQVEDIKLKRRDPLFFGGTLSSINSAINFFDHEPDHSSEELEDAIADFKKGKKSRPSVSNVYGEQVKILTGQLHDWYDAIDSSKFGTERVHDKAREIIKVLKGMKEMVEELPETESTITDEQKKEAENVRKKLREELDNIKAEAAKSGTSKEAVRKQIRLKMDEYLGEIRKINGGESVFSIEGATNLVESLLPGSNNEIQFKEALVQEYLKAVKELSSYLPDALAKPPASSENSADNSSETIDPKTVPHHQEIDKLVALTKKGAGRSEAENKEFEKLKKDLLAKYNGERTTGQQKMEAYLQQKGFRLNKTTGELVPASTTLADGNDPVVDALKKLPPEFQALSTFLTSIWTVFKRALNRQQQTPGQVQPGAVPSDLHQQIAKLEQDINAYEQRIKNKQSGGGGGADSEMPNVQVVDPLDTDFAALQQMNAELDQLQGQQAHVDQTAQWMSNMFFPNGQFHFEWNNGSFHVPGMPMTQLKWRASMAGCNGNCVHSGISMHNGHAAFDTSFSNEILSHPNDIFNEMALNYDTPFNDHEFFNNPLDASRHFNWSYRHALAA